MRRLMLVRDRTLTSTNESALLATLTHGYEEQPESLTDAPTSENESEPRSLLKTLVFEQSFYDQSNLS